MICRKDRGGFTEVGKGGDLVLYLPLGSQEHKEIQTQKFEKKKY